MTVDEVKAILSYKGFRWRKEKKSETEIEYREAYTRAVAGLYRVLTDAPSKDRTDI